MAAGALAGDPKATRILYFCLRKQLEGKKEWWVRGWTRRELAAELLLCLFEAITVFQAKLTSGFQLQPRELLAAFWTLCKQKLSRLIKAANREAEAVVARPEYRDPRDRYAYDPTEGDDKEVSETVAEKLRRIIERVRLRATPLQKRVLAGLEGTLADQEETASLLGALAQYRRLRCRPRDIATYVDGVTPKGLSKALRGLRTLFAEELEREELGNLIPRGWGPTRVR